MRKVISIIIGILGITLVITGFFMLFSLSNETTHNTAIIGGADKPTAIFILNNTPFLYYFIAGIIFIIISLVMLFKKKR